MLTGPSAAAYLAAWATSMYRGWTVRFDTGAQVVAVEPARLAIGLGNAWSCCPPEGGGPVPPKDAPRVRFRNVCFHVFTLTYS